MEVLELTDLGARSSDSSNSAFPETRWVLSKLLHLESFSLTPIPLCRNHSYKVRSPTPFSEALKADLAIPSPLTVPDDKIVAALAVILDVRNHPMLIHCNKGKVSLSSAPLSISRCFSAGPFGCSSIADLPPIPTAPHRLPRWLSSQGPAMVPHRHL